MTTPDWIPAISAIASVVSAIAAAISANLAKAAKDENKRINRDLLAASEKANKFSLD